MRVLLVYTNQAQGLLPAPPIGLAYVASAAHAAGHEIHLLDLYYERSPVRALRTALRRFRPDVVGLSLRNIDNVVRQNLRRHLDAVPAMIAAVRAEGSAPIVLGGPAVSLLGPAALARLEADYAVLGEGEAVFPALLAALAEGRDPGSIPGVCARGRQTSTLPTRLTAFGASGLERWLDWEPYRRHGATWPIQTKRGCPFRCAYCAYNLIEGHCLRRRDPEEVVDEIERVQALIDPWCFEFVDATFNHPITHAKAICEAIIRRGLRVRLTAMGIHPLGVDAELLTLMRRAGFNSLMSSPESASDATLQGLRKDFTAADVARAARLARASGLDCAWFFMLGGPGETEATVEETVVFAERHLNWRNSFSIFVTGIRILPGTELARIARAEGLLAPDTDLAEPVFYLSPAVSEDRILGRVNAAQARNPGIVHAAEEGRSLYERAMYRLLARARVAPPYWRFLPALLRLPFLRALRRAYPRVGRRAVR